MEDEEQDISYKLIIVGDTGVGKTNILSRFIIDDFSIETPSTITMEFGRKILELDGLKVKLQIWDTAGQEKYRSLTQSYFKGSKGAFIVYDVTREDTFQKVQGWYDDIKSAGDKECVIGIIGNKIDLEESRQISTDIGKRKADELQTLFAETSALQGLGINEAFEELVKKIMSSKSENITNPGETDANKNIDLVKDKVKSDDDKGNSPEEKKKKKCC